MATPRLAPQDAVASLARQPDDGWVRAEPWPMSASTQAALLGVVRAVCPPAGSGAPTDEAMLLEVVRRVRASMPYMSPLAAWGLVALFRLLDLAPLWRLRGVRRLRRWPAEQGAALLDDLGHSRVGLLATTVIAARAAVMTAYFDIPAVHDAIGYSPVPFMRERIAARRTLLASAERGDAAIDALRPTEAALAAARDRARADDDGGAAPVPGAPS